MKKRILFYKSKYIIFVLLFILIFSSFPLIQSRLNQSENQIIYTYSFDKPNIESINIKGVIYSRVSLIDCLSAGKPGEPDIPSKGVNILLPPSSKIKDINIITGEKHILTIGYSIEPVGEPLPITFPSGILW